MDQFQNFSVISWNIRGALGRSRRRHVKDMVALYHPSLFLVFETHGAFAKVEHLWSSLGYKLLYVQESRSHAGGIWVLSNVDNLTLSLVDSMSQAITFYVTKGNASWSLSAVYASPTFSMRCPLWTHLIALRRCIMGPWVLLGDPNEVLTSNEVAGGTFCPSRALLLKEMMDECNFMDLDIIGGKLFWRKNTQNGGHCRKKLDRVMADVDWHLHFPHAMVELLPPHDSDHNHCFSVAINLLQ